MPQVLTRRTRLILRSLSLLFALFFVSTLTACTDAEPDEGAEIFVSSEAPTQIYDPSDLEETLLEKNAAIPGLPSTFNRQRLMEDSFYTDTHAVSAAAIQRFFENNPYGKRTFLASFTVSGKSAAQALVEAAQAEQINPILLVSRMQVEKGLISLTSNPGGNRVDFAFGCGCPDNRRCSEAYRGLDKQLQCAARTLRRAFDDSIARTGSFNQGVARRTLDPITITPANHATAALYTYTPWVQQGVGGNWLVWNVTLRFARHFAAQGTLTLNGQGGAAEGGGGQAGQPVVWIGHACERDEQCHYGGGARGLCVSGMCTQACEGLCPDRANTAPTFCVDAVLFGQPSGGLCAPQAHALNGLCQNSPGERFDVQRFIGRSGVASREASVCVPAPADHAAPAPQPEEPLCQEGSQWCEGDVQVQCAGGRPLYTDCGQGTCEAGQCVQPAPAGCGAIDSFGTCQGDQAVRCVGGELVAENCSLYGQACGESSAGAACEPNRQPYAQDAQFCQQIGFEGICQGEVAIWCVGSEIYAEHCAWGGRECRWGDDGDGHWCRRD